MLIVQIKPIFFIIRTLNHFISSLKGKLVFLYWIHLKLCFGPLITAVSEIRLVRLAFYFLSLPFEHSYALNHLIPFHRKKLLMWVVVGLPEYVMTVRNLHDGRWLNFYEQLFVIVKLLIALHGKLLAFF